MALHLALAIAFAAGNASAPEMCSGVVRETEPDMQIQESDLDAASAASAAERLREKVSLGQVDGEYHYGALNNLKILEGHVRLQQALADRRGFGAGSSEAKDSKASFCRWLVNEGFWYD